MYAIEAKGMNGFQTTCMISKSNKPTMAIFEAHLKSPKTHHPLCLSYKHKSEGVQWMIFKEKYKNEECSLGLPRLGKKIWKKIQKRIF